MNSLFRQFGGQGLRILHERLVAAGGSDAKREFRTLYFVRRALATLVEFRSGLSGTREPQAPTGHTLKVTV
jgi:hypothetical protein